MAWVLAESKWPRASCTKKCNISSSLQMKRKALVVHNRRFAICGGGNGGDGLGTRPCQGFWNERGWSEQTRGQATECVRGGLRAVSLSWETEKGGNALNIMPRGCVTFRDDRGAPEIGRD